MRFAIIENEFGDVGIDEKIINQNLKEKIDEELIEVMNGCICCTVRGDLVETLKKMAKRVQNFDGVIIETTGLAGTWDVYGKEEAGDAGYTHHPPPSQCWCGPARLAARPMHSMDGHTRPSTAMVMGPDPRWPALYLAAAIRRSARSTDWAV